MFFTILFAYSLHYNILLLKQDSIIYKMACYYCIIFLFRIWFRDWSM